jgi:hypothetical protein
MVKPLYKADILKYEYRILKEIVLDILPITCTIYGTLLYLTGLYRFIIFYSGLLLIFIVQIIQELNFNYYYIVEILHQDNKIYITFLKKNRIKKIYILIGDIQVKYLKTLTRSVCLKIYSKDRLAIKVYSNVSSM